MAAIMFTDMVGYTALGQKNESLSLVLVEEQRRLIRPILNRHDGREVKTMGDAFLVEFPSALESVRCAYEIQRAAREYNLPLSEEKQIHLRVGLHVGDVVKSDGDVSGDAVNVASRIEPIAEDGGVCLTRQAYDQVKGKFELPLISIGSKTLKNVAEPVEIFKVVMPWQTDVREPRLEFDRRRIAILPFANMSPDPNDSYFADGITEEMISTVSGISGLSVISRTSVMAYKGSTKKLGEIGKELSVGSILEGSFRKAGNRVRITAQLIDVRNDTHIWAQNFDRELNDVFAVQSEIARQVAEALRVRIISGEAQRLEKRPTENPAAHALYLKGRYLWNKRGLEDIRKAAEYFGQSVKEDPGFALGYAGLADCYHLLDVNWQLDSVVNNARAVEMVGRALELNPDLAEAHTTRANILLHDFKVEKAEEEFRRAIELEPSYATAHQWYHHLLEAQGRWDEALAEIEKAVDLDPLSPIINANLATYYFLRRDYRKAVELQRKALDLNPGSGDLHFAIAVDYSLLGMFEEARREMDTGAKLVREVYPLIEINTELWMAQAGGDRQKVAASLPKAEVNLQETGMNAFDVASYHFYLGEKDKGFEWLEGSFSNREMGLLFIQSDIRMDGVRSDPRYHDLVKKLGLVPTSAL